MILSIASGNEASAGHAHTVLPALVSGFEAAHKNQKLSLVFDFQDLSITLPDGKKILQGVTGSIKPVCGWIRLYAGKCTRCMSNLFSRDELQLLWALVALVCPNPCCARPECIHPLTLYVAGKTTFMNCLMGKSKRTGGTLRINHAELEMSKLKQLIGYVPQVCISFPLDYSTNVSLRLLSAPLLV